jgi:hypothetical protein
MIAKKNFSMDVLVDLMMTKLFILAEYVCDKTSCACGHKLLPQKRLKISPIDYFGPL